MGAHVTAVCSTPNVELVRSLGADVVVDYKKECVDAAAASNKFDKIIDAVGRSGWRPLLNPGGAVVAVALPHPESECIPCTLCQVVCSPCCCCCLTSKKWHAFMQSVEVADMQELAEMLAAGSLRAVVGQRLAGLGEVPDALVGHSATLGQGHCVGKTVVSIGAHPEEMQRK
jgi:NADPH:quinone reductase-like Zn-dependent oxidoreductase